MNRIMKAYNTPPKLLAVIEQMYENTRAKVISPDRDTDFFLIKAGVLQGDKLAPYLFAILPILIKFMPKNGRAKPKTEKNRKIYRFSSNLSLKSGGRTQKPKNFGKFSRIYA